MSAYVIITNWNGWQDAIECLESVFRLRSADFRVVVCDNNSADGSIEKLKAWANGGLLATAANPQLSHLVSPPVPKPIRYVEFNRAEAETCVSVSNAPLTFIHVGKNLGYAGGINVGLRYALRDPSSGFYWMLNNDTVVDPDALEAMVRRMQECKEMGLCGSLSLSYAHPEEVQCEGGCRYSRWTGRVFKSSVRNDNQLAPDEAPFDYVYGASMLASRNFLETVGLMDESYFAYFEEMDWAMRARGKFSLGYARDSVIFHKEGAALGSNANRAQRSIRSDKYLARSRALFTRRFFPWALPTVIAAISIAALHRAAGGDWRRARAMMGSMFLGLHENANRESGN